MCCRSSGSDLHCGCVDGFADESVLSSSTPANLATAPVNVLRSSSDSHSSDFAVGAPVNNTRPGAMSSLGVRKAIP